MAMSRMDKRLMLEAPPLLQKDFLQFCPRELSSLKALRESPYMGDEEAGEQLFLILQLRLKHLADGFQQTSGRSRRVWRGKLRKCPAVGTRWTEGRGLAWWGTPMVCMYTGVTCMFTEASTPHRSCCPKQGHPMLHRDLLRGWGRRQQ